MVVGPIPDPKDYLDLTVATPPPPMVGVAAAAMQV